MENKNSTQLNARLKSLDFHTRDIYQKQLGFFRFFSPAIVYTAAF